MTRGFRRLTIQGSAVALAAVAGIAFSSLNRPASAVVAGVATPTQVNEALIEGAQLDSDNFALRATDSEAIAIAVTVTAARQDHQADPNALHHWPPPPAPKERELAMLALHHWPPPPLAR